MNTPQSNVTLTLVVPEGSTDEWSGASDGAQKWSGRARGYLSETRRRSRGEDANVRLERKLILCGADATRLPFEDGDTVTFLRDQGGAEETATVAAVERFEASMVPESLWTLRLYLAAA